MKIKAVIPVHLYGQCADMQGISKIAAKFKLKVIEDAAQAFGAEFKGRKAGTIGDFGAVSFYPARTSGLSRTGGWCLLAIRRPPGNWISCVIRGTGTGIITYFWA
jgi:dTDP-4-amino-4,6-dideoxygalactose transaminase